MIAFQLLSDYMGPDKALAFMFAFAGTVLKIPQMNVTERISRERQIASSLQKDPTTPAVRRLANLHGVPMRAIAKSFFKQTGLGLKTIRARMCLPLRTY